VIVVERFTLVMSHQDVGPYLTDDLGDVDYDLASNL
jgi:hypothetical protein